jgi:hypothetical protein
VQACRGAGVGWCRCRRVSCCRFCAWAWPCRSARLAPGTPGTRRGLACQGAARPLWLGAAGCAGKLRLARGRSGSRQALACQVAASVVRASEAGRAAGHVLVGRLVAGRGGLAAGRLRGAWGRGAGCWRARGGLLAGAGRAVCARPGRRRGPVCDCSPDGRPYLPGGAIGSVVGLFLGYTWIVLRVVSWFW